MAVRSNVKPKSVIRPTSLGQCFQKVVYYCLFCFFLASFCFLLGHYARITPSFKDKNPLKNKAKNPNNSNDRFGLNFPVPVWGNKGKPGNTVGGMDRGWTAPSGRQRNSRG